MRWSHLEALKIFSRTRISIRYETLPNLDRGERSLLTYWKETQRKPIQLLPDLGEPMNRKGLNLLASSLVSAGTDLGQAMLICGLCCYSMETDYSDLRMGGCARRTPRLDSEPRQPENRPQAVSSGGELLLIHRLLCRKKTDQDYSELW